MERALNKTKLGKLFACLACVSLLSGCGNSEKEAPALKLAPISEDEKFGCAVISSSEAEFESLGFALGDSCDVAFSNGKSYTDVPFYNGYYVRNGDPVLVAYPSNEQIHFTLNNVGIWASAQLSGSMTVDITLKEKGKYLATQEALGQSYSLERDQYGSDEEFCNFRALEGGDLKEGLIFRGASPFDNSRKRASTTDALLRKSSIKAIVDLADGEGDMTYYRSEGSYSFPYSEDLYLKGDVALLAMGSSYGSDAYKQSVAEGIRHMLSHEGPYYIHCMEGKDRTGFVCTLIEALAGASYAEMRDDYMKTYANYYKVTQAKDPEKYQAIVNLYFDSFCECLHGESDKNALFQASYVGDAKAYLKEGGLKDSEIASFKNLISK